MLFRFILFSHASYVIVNLSGPWENNEDWTEKFRRVISERLGMATGGCVYVTLYKTTIKQI